MIIEPYILQPIEFLPFDENLPKIASILTAHLSAIIPNIQVEHIGSTAVPGTPGKNIINLLLVTESDRLDSILDALVRLGFQKSPLNKQESPELPLRVGMVRYQDKPYYVHVHTTKQGSRFHKSGLFFRDYLLQHSEIIPEYARIKKEAVESGKTDALSYNKAKEPFIQSVLEQMPKG